MSEADKMFEELGYKKIEDESFIRYFKESNRRCDDIMFYKRPKTVHINNKWNCLNMKLLQAINKKVEELGWNE